MRKQYKVKQFILKEDAQIVVDSETGTQHKIGRHDFLTLLELAKHSGQILSKAHLMEKGWPGKIVSDSSLTQSIRNIRNLIEDNGKNQLWLKTVAKVGYVLDSSIVEQLIDSSAASPDSTKTKPTSIPTKEGLKGSNLFRFKYLYLNLLIILVTVSIKLYNEEYIRKPVLLSYPNLSYQHEYLSIYSDDFELSDKLASEILKMYRSSPSKPEKLFIMITDESLSFSYIGSDGIVVNKVILNIKDLPFSYISARVVEELNNVEI
ncbi:transcriptional regulator [Vibrio parahaemolyticus]|uniref:winged helix-turn-helix domain-containing protein n=1 Tax=Vibrio parahaemolyticus TaxID=670 RepID=UPI00073EE933|nr:winged helix-turn-helix domain-containing protein [Vibrio parahaemolyticus]KUH62135.1 transcriptional regulator [Vibrio parahaemolyticus]